MYGKVNGPMTQQTPFHPSSKKGEVRAEIATMLLNEIKQGNLTACIARSADFYGPHAKTSVVNILVFDKFAKREKAAIKPGTYQLHPTHQQESNLLKWPQRNLEWSQNTGFSPGQ